LPKRFKRNLIIDVLKILLYDSTLLLELMGCST